MTSDPFNLPARTGLVATAVHGLLGAAFTGGLFLGIAHFQHSAPPVPALETGDLRQVALPLEPPPAREVPPEAAPEVTTFAGFEATPADSPVKITVLPPDVADLLPPAPVAPPAVIQVGQLFANFKPHVDLTADTQRIFQTSEVDQLPHVVYTVTPEVTRRMLKDGPVHATLLLIVDANGVVTSAKLAQSSGNAELDAIMVQNIREWVFSPATRRGKRVRCLIQQGYNIRLPATSPFTT